MLQAWNRYGAVRTAADGGSMTATPDGRGLGWVTAFAAGAKGGKANPETPNYLLRSLSAPVAYSTGKPRTVAEVTAIIAAAGKKERATYAKYGSLERAKEMSQVAMVRQ